MTAQRIRAGCLDPDLVVGVALGGVEVEDKDQHAGPVKHHHLVVIVLQADVVLQHTEKKPHKCDPTSQNESQG